MSKLYKIALRASEVGDFRRYLTQDLTHLQATGEAQSLPGKYHHKLDLLRRVRNLEQVLRQPDRLITLEIDTRPLD